jgi:hypothetical protein
MGITDSITAATGNITVNERRESGGESGPPAIRPNHRRAALPALVLGVVILALAAPRLIGALLGLGPLEIAKSARGGSEIGISDLTAAAADIDSIPAMLRSADQEAERGYLLARAAAASPPGPARDRLLAESDQALTRSVLRSPGDPESWLRRSWLKQQQGDTAAALASFRMSMQVGPAESDMMAPRLRFGATLASLMEPETRAMFDRQIRLAWVLRPDTVAVLAQDPVLGPLIPAALDSLSPDEIKRYSRLHGRVAE